MNLGNARRSTDENDLDGLLLAFEEMGLVLNRYDPFEDMAAMQRGYSDPVPQSQAKEASKVSTAAVRALKQQLKPGGVLVLPVGPDGGNQRYVRVTRHADGHGFEDQVLFGGRYVPLTTAAKQLASM